MVIGSQQPQRAVLRRPVMAATMLAQCVAISLALPGSASAQSASAVTPDSFQPQLQRLDGAIVFSGATGARAPAGAEQIGITLSGVKLDDPLPQMAAANAALQSRLTAGRIPVSELFNAVNDLEAAYADAGYVLARVVLPQQSLRDGGVLRVAVVNGFVETVDSTGLPDNVRARIATLTAPLVDKKGVALPDLERQLLLAGDVAGVALGSALTAGQQPGGTVVMLDAEYRTITGFVGFDNLASEELGTFVLNAGVEFNSPLGFGESFYARMSASPHQILDADPRYRIFAVGAVMPLGPSGLALNVELTTSDTTPDDSTAPTRSNFDRQSLRLIYPWIRSRQFNLTTQVALDRQQDDQALIVGGSETPIYEDNITVLRASASISYIHDDNAVSEGSMVLSHGVDAFGARTKEDAAGSVPLSRQGADAEFTKLTLSGFHQRSLADRLMLSLSGRVQTSFGDPLVTSEQISIAGARDLSAFDSGSLRGDSGWLLRAELASQFPTTMAGTPMVLSPYIFAGVGAVSIEQTTAVEHGHEGASSYGIGLDLISQTNSRFRSNSVRIELAKGDRDHGSDETRFSISGNFRF
ncbi:ShlB/FhaC/HecB family hemolysin secretion/activation protein [Puniceibacterium sp. IMCC21224]|uniref:ShlB/FhaC/HecB family hemolysin secretion/activation protein n=1 Tax=Puniceibacterium sp. IMCC21224 TaxID=1618204 RepID=UPI00065DA040|nr:ShlB/FhaC/HecB family hemolysin secretion/activation protein [Puniceibacterium sp. IMCC21224]KMK65803.1 hemolysin activation/secretion protein [Puniceibacterium sp. IMCC21224]